jgi:hypothetical protein
MKRIDSEGRNVTGLFGLYDEGDTVFDLGEFVCLSGQPVCELEGEEDYDPWAECHDRMVRQFWEAVYWLDVDWLTDEICQHLPTEIDYDTIWEAVSQMLALHNPDDEETRGNL